jgi:hypothetical protein
MDMKKIFSHLASGGIVKATSTTIPALQTFLKLEDDGLYRCWSDTIGEFEKDYTMSMTYELYSFEIVGESLVKESKSFAYEQNGILIYRTQDIGESFSTDKFTNWKRSPKNCWLNMATP